MKTKFFLGGLLALILALFIGTDLAQDRPDIFLMAIGTAVAGAAGAATQDPPDPAEAPAQVETLADDPTTREAEYDAIVASLLRNPDFRATLPGQGTGDPPPEPAPEPTRQRAGAPAIAPTDGASVPDSQHNRQARLATIYTLAARIVIGSAHRNRPMVGNAVRELLGMQAYSPEAVRFMSTLTDGAGGIFLPTAVEQGVTRLIPEHGLMRRLSTPYGVSTGDRRLPNLTEKLTAFFTGEGNEIKARKVSFIPVTIDPDSMGLIVPLTEELGEEAGPTVMPLIMALIAEALAEAEDDGGFNGDGTANYNGITGVMNMAGIGSYVATGATTLGALTAFHLKDAKYKADYRARKDGYYIFHHDFGQYLEGLKDDQNRPIYIHPTDTTQPPTLWQRPVYYSQAMPDPSGVATGDVFGLFGNLRYVAFGSKPGIRVKELTEATILDVDDTTPIRLATRNMRAVRVVQYIDIQVQQDAAFAELKLA